MHRCKPSQQTLLGPRETPSSQSVGAQRNSQQTLSDRCNPGPVVLLFEWLLARKITLSDCTIPRGRRVTMSSSHATPADPCSGMKSAPAIVAVPQAMSQQAMMMKHPSILPLSTFSEPRKKSSQE